MITLRFLVRQAGHCAGTGVFSLTKVNGGGVQTEMVSKKAMKISAFGAMFSPTLDFG